MYKGLTTPTMKGEWVIGRVCFHKIPTWKIIFLIATLPFASPEMSSRYLQIFLIAYTSIEMRPHYLQIVNGVLVSLDFFLVVFGGLLPQMIQLLLLLGDKDD